MASKTNQKNMFTVLSDESDSDGSTSIPSTQDSQVGTNVTNSSRSPTPSITNNIQVTEENYSTKDEKSSNIIPFQGRATTPLVKVDHEEFSSIGSENENEKKKGESRRGRKKNLKEKKVISFIAGKSYIDELRRERQIGDNFNSNDRRSMAFARMEDKELLAKSLVATKACNNVKPCEKGGYTVCYREKCSFAHSLEELNDPMCGFDSSCRFRNGRPRRDGTLDPNGKCICRHSDETRDAWLHRTGRKIPNLPETSENTRKPTSRKNTTETSPKKIESNEQSKTGLVTPPTRIVVTEPKTPRKSLWDEKPKRFDMSESFSKYRDKSSSESSSDEECRSSRRSRHTRRYYRSRRSRSRSPIKHKTKSESQVIRVPTKELAEMAIKAAFDRGVYNIQVLVE